MQSVKTIIFDWDGTLHESIHIYFEAFLKGYQDLVESGVAPIKDWTKDEVSKFLGVSPKALWDELLPYASDIDKKNASKTVGNYMLKAILEGHAKLYPEAKALLTYLKNKGYSLIYLSNSNIYYMEAMRDFFHLEQYFDEFIVSETYKYIPKKEILKLIKPQLKAPMVMIGDRYLDIETGLENGVKTIGCLYGYGSQEELKDADLIIYELKELYHIF